MRPSFVLLIIISVLLAGNVAQVVFAKRQNLLRSEARSAEQHLVTVTGFADLVISTEARYTRHLSISDRVVPFMDHPGSLEHFPSGSLLKPPCN